ncbi:acyl-CoA thioesterase [Pseudohongiella spirulinae]|nr:acyl-CoA thioesterase [Pseudohongiella spirulinae]
MTENTTDDEFVCAMSVRDYECDMQGVVNNSVYQNYLEHARHEYLKTRGLDFATLTREGIIVVVVRAEIDYLQPLKSGDSIFVTAKPVLEKRIRLVFNQSIRHSATGREHVRARIVTTAVSERGRPYFPESLNVLL